MRGDVDEFPSWIFDLDEVSAGVYRIHAQDVAGRSIEMTGTDPGALTEDCKNAIRDLLQCGS